MSELLYGWTSVEDALPETKPGNWYMTEMSEKVLVCGTGKNAYPWVAHLHADEKQNYPDYAHGFDRGGKRYTWLNPYRDHVEGQAVTHWKAI